MKYLKNIVEMQVVLFALITWMAGIVLAKGFWLTLLSCVCPFYGWYLLTEKIMHMNGML
jgi:hypothetical protein